MADHLTHPIVPAALAALALTGTAPKLASAAQAAGKYKTVGKPRVTFEPTPLGGVVYRVTARFDRALPTGASGTVDARATINGFGPSFDFTEYGTHFVRVGSPARHTYQEATTNIASPLPASLKSPKPGQIVRVRIAVRGVNRTITRSVRLTRR